QDSIAKELNYVIHHSEARFVIAEDEEQVDKLYEIKDQIPHVERVVYYYPRGLELNDDPWLIHLAEMQKLGDAFAAREPDYFANELAQGQSDDVCMYSYTSGTTGMPKGVMLTHGNILMVVHGTIELENMTADDIVMAYLPMAWIGDYFLSVGTAVVAGMAVCCPESPETLSRDFRESGPTVTVAPPAVWEGLLTRIQVRMEDADWLKRGLFNAAM
ncbi:MAG: AMP-binding protein, partial [Paracoccaceae bacterium]|nr:AMP-binding protein [Paracoccaceae bacterium]